MDPITDLPPIAVHYAGDPSSQMTTQPAHPPYAEMITAAISALKDRDGSSRQAISKYIEKKFINLPPTHSVLLTHHLKRLKNLGQLIIVKHSYMLPPRSGQFQPATLDFNAISNVGNVTDPNVANVGGLNLENSPSGLSKRKPGRPPKLKPVHGLGVVQNPMPNVQPFDANAHPPSYEPQFPYHVGVGQDLQIINGSSLDFQGNSVGGGSEPLFASLGLGDDGVAVPSPLPTENTPVVAKRGRGRPPKSSGGRPVKSKSGKGRWPPKSSGDGSGARVVVSGGGSQGEILGDVSGSGARVVVSGGGSQGEILGDVSGSGEGESEGVERPVKKSKRMSVMGGNGVRVKKGRGRPRRIGFGAVTVPLSGNLLLPRTRPKRVARSIAAAVNGGVGETVSGPKRPARKFTGKRVGRPSKGGRGTAVLVTDPRQLVVYQELKSKYELLQSKVKQVASMVRSSIDPHYGNAALWALQELEALAGGGVEVNNAPSHDQIQEPEP